MKEFMNKTKIRDQFTIEDCVVYGMGSNNYIFEAKCEAVVETRIHEKTLHTKSGTEYIAKLKEYALVICRKPETNLTFESIENVENFSATFTFGMPNGENKNYRIDDITPEEIDFDGDWTFKISNSEGYRLYMLHEKAMSI